MRGKVTDIDLTNYALNELPPEERLYVESMLGVSEECRNDVYQMLELGEMLKEGYEFQEEQALLTLDETQRSKVLAVSSWNFRALLRQAAAPAGSAGLQRPHMLTGRQHGRQLARRRMIEPDEAFAEFS